MTLSDWQFILCHSSDTRSLSPSRRGEMAITAYEVERKDGREAAVRWIESQVRPKPATSTGLEMVMFWHGRDMRDMTAPELLDVIRILGPLSGLIRQPKRGG